MKWNGSIYYNVISQDNARVDRTALKRVPCPPHYQRYRDSPEQTEPGSATTQPKLLTPFAFLIWTGTDSGRENGWRGPGLGPEEASGWWLTPQRWKTVLYSWSHSVFRSSHEEAGQRQHPLHAVRTPRSDMQESPMQGCTGCEEEIPAQLFHTGASPHLRVRITCGALKH